MSHWVPIFLVILASLLALFGLGLAIGMTVRTEMAKSRATKEEPRLFQWGTPENFDDLEHRMDGLREAKGR